MEQQWWLHQEPAMCHVPAFKRCAAMFPPPHPFLLQDPERFVRPDPEMAATLLDQKEAGKMLLLITNRCVRVAGGARGGRGE